MIIPSSSLETVLQKYIDLALLNTADIVRKKLEFFIELDYYEKYTPIPIEKGGYDRTNQFKDSPQIMSFTHNIVEIFVNTDSMNYQDATGDYVAKLAMQGFHGNELIFREGYYWKDFIDWCERNVIKIFKEELIKLGLRTS